MAPPQTSIAPEKANAKTLEELRFDNRYATLPEIFYSHHHPAALKNARLLHFNHDAATLIDLDPAQAGREDFVDIVTGAKPLPGFDPIACCYAGHQFGHFVPRLGDGRAILLGEVLNDDGRRWDLHLKGAGLTRYSRQGDGRAVLRSSIREYLCSAAMHGLGIGTTHALCLTGSDEPVYRERIETGATVLRMAPSHIRFGTFEYFYYSQRIDDLRTLANYTIETHFPHLLENERPYLALLTEVIDSTARLMAQWQSVGFMHGVMNTDNMSIHGITIDYGPFGFMEAYEPGYICNHSDHSGRYAYNKQPEIALFNLSCLAQALVPLFDPEPEKSAELATAELHNYQDIYIDYFASLMRSKIGLTTARDEDQALCTSMFELMRSNTVDFTRFFRALSTADTAARNTATRALFKEPTAADAWLDQYEDRLSHESDASEAREKRMRRLNPKYVLRNFMAETAIRKAEDEQDYSEIDRLMNLLATPFDEHPDMEHYAGAVPDWATGLSVSCSS
ncbi:MAG: YdiU family protein [Pseudomonadota bacterium]